MGVIPSGQENHSGAEHLNFPGGELNVIFLQSNISLRKNQRPVNLESKLNMKRKKIKQINKKLNYRNYN